MKLSNNKIWNWPQTFNYFLPVVVVSIVMIFFGVPIWLLYTYVVSTVIWAALKYNQ